MDKVLQSILALIKNQTQDTQLPLTHFNHLAIGSYQLLNLK